MGPKGQEGYKWLEKGRRRGFLDIRVSSCLFGSGEGVLG